MLIVNFLKRRKQQLLSDAKRLSTRLRDHDQTADLLTSRAQEVLKQVDSMRQYQEDVDNFNEVAHNRPRAQLVLGIQQENNRIRYWFYKIILIKC